MRDYGGYYKYATQYYEQGRYEQALEYIRYALKYSPYEQAFLELKKEIEAKLYGYNYAEDDLDDYNYGVYDYGGYYKYATKYYKQGRYEQALEYIEHAIKNAPYEQAFLELKKEIELSMKNMPAIQEAEKEVELNDDDISVYISKAEAFKEKGQYNLAIENYNKVIELSPENSFVYISRADCYRELEQYDLAIKDYTKVIELFPKYYLGYLGRGSCYKALKKHELARKDNEEALKLSFNEGMKLFKDCDFKNAIDYLKTAAELSPDDKEIASAIEAAQSGKINIMTCTKKGILTLGCFDEEKAEKFISERNNGKVYYDIESLVEDFGLMPHQMIEISDKLIFPLKQGAKLGRKIDF